MSERAEPSGGILWNDADDADAIQRLRTLVNGLDDGVYQLDSEGRFVAANDSFLEASGYARDELLGEHVSSVVRACDGSADPEAIERRLADPNDRTDVLDVAIGPDGSTTRCEVRATRLEEVTDSSGSIGVVRDATEVTSAARRDSASDRDTNPVADAPETLPIGVVVYDEAGTIIHLDERAADLLEVPDGDRVMFSSADRAFFDEDGRPIDADERPFARALETEEPVFGRVLRVEVPSGDRRWLSISAVPRPSIAAGRVVTTIEDVTTLKERERELENELDQVFGRVSDAFYALDDEFRFVRLNERAEELLDRSAEELEGRVVWEAFPDFLQTDLYDRFHAAMEANEPDRIERYSDHLGIWEEVYVYPSDSGLSVYFHDVTERKEVERELRERERQLSTLMDNVPGMVYRCRNERGWPMEFVTEGCRELTGYEPDHLERDDLSYGEDIVVEADRDALWEEIQGGVDDREPFSATYRIETVEGEIRWVRDRGRGVFDDDGELERLEGVIIDVTERKRVRQQLEEERDMFAQGPAIVFRWKNEAGWPVEHVSENVEEVLGYSPCELESGDVPYTDLLLDEEIERIAREVEENSDETTDRFSHDPYRVKTKDGDVRWVKDVTKVIRDDDGDVTNYLGYLVDITERKERERELTRYETIVETMNDGIYVKDEDGRFTMVNDAYAELTGYDREELVGAHASLVVDEATIRQSREQRGTANDPVDGSEETMEAAVQTADGDLVPAEGTSATIGLDNGETREVGVVRDISQRKRRERDLERKERRYQAVFEDPNILVGLLEPDGTVLDINQTAMEYIDVGLDEVTGEPFWETPWWGEDEGVRHDVREWTERAATGEYVDFEADLAQPGGERYTLSGFFRPVTNDDDEVVSIIVSDRDITERRRRERELEESERRYRALAENFPNGAVALVDGDLRYRTVGGNPVDVADVTVDEVEGSAVEDAMPRELAEELVPRYEAAFEGEASSFEADTNGRIYQFQTVPIRNDDGEVFAALGMSQDITERREYERRLETSNERLEQFAYAASHDLQEPLRMVSSYLQLIDDRYGDEFDEDGEEFLEFAIDGAERMREMIASLLQYSRVETQGDPFESVDLNDVLADVRTDLQFRIDDSGAEITAGELPRVRGDANQLRQLFQNLLDNALEYSGDEPPQVRVSADRGGGRWVVDVEDDGIGIDQGDQDRIFEVFQRLHTRDEHEGTGVGLALCQRIVERHGGEIRVDSEPGEGATFSFTLPVAGE